MPSRSLSQFIILSFCVLFSYTIYADKHKPIASENFSGTVLKFSQHSEVTNITLSISGPNRYTTTVYAKDEIPILNLLEYGAYDDGKYNYLLRAATHDSYERRSPINNGREKESNKLRKMILQSGSFRISKGEIVQFEDQEESKKE